MKIFWNKLKRKISVIEAIKHDVATRMHFEDYSEFKRYKGRDKEFGRRWINFRIFHYIKTGEFDNCKEIAEKLFKNGGTEIQFIYATTK